MQTHNYVQPCMYFGVWNSMNLDSNAWYIDPKHTFTLILKGNSGYLLVCNYFLIYLDPVSFCNGLKIAVFHSEAN